MSTSLRHVGLKVRWEQVQSASDRLATGLRTDVDSVGVKRDTSHDGEGRRTR